MENIPGHALRTRKVKQAIATLINSLFIINKCGILQSVSLI